MDRHPSPLELERARAEDEAAQAALARAQRRADEAATRRAQLEERARAVCAYCGNRATVSVTEVREFRDARSPDLVRLPGRRLDYCAAHAPRGL